MKIDRRKFGKRRYVPLNKKDLVWVLCPKSEVKLGKIVSIDGGYYFVRVLEKHKWIGEFYRIELAKATDEEALMWYLQL